MATFTEAQWAAWRGLAAEHAYRMPDAELLKVPCVAVDRLIAGVAHDTTMFVGLVAEADDGVRVSGFNPWSTKLLIGAVAQAARDAHWGAVSDMPRVIKALKCSASAPVVATVFARVLGDRMMLTVRRPIERGMQAFALTRDCAIWLPTVVGDAAFRAGWDEDMVFMPRPPA